MSRASQPGNAQKSRALELLRTGGLYRMRDLATQGIGPETMTRLVREGQVVRQARGVYQIATGPNDARHAYAAAAALTPKGVICLISALQFHDLTLQRPSAIWVAIDRSGWKPTVSYPPMRFVRFSAASLHAGVERHRIENVAVAVFDPAKSVVDCFRYRNKIGLDVALEGLREGLRRKRLTVDQLWRYAGPGRVWSVMRPYVEAVSADDA